jgi:hypothetical protein
MKQSFQTATALPHSPLIKPTGKFKPEVAFRPAAPTLRQG